MTVAETERARAVTAGTTRLVVAGAHLAGQPLHPMLLQLGARLLATTMTAPVYRMVVLPAIPAADGLTVTPPRPGLVRAPGRGRALEVEVYELPVDALGRLLLTVEPPLAIGTVSLADDPDALGFVCEGYATGTAPDITGHGGWRRYLTSAGPEGHRTPMDIAAGR